MAPSLKAAEKLALKGIEATVVNARYAKPLDKELIVELCRRIKRVVTVEENVLNGGFGSSIAKLLQESGICDVMIKNIGIPDEFVEHGTQAVLRAKYGMYADGIENRVMELFPGSFVDITSKVKNKARTAQ